MHEKRRSYLLNLVRDRDWTGLEIGALDKPLIVPKDLSDGSEIIYADHLSSTDLKAKYKLDQSVDLDSIVDVSIVNPAGDFSECMEGRLVDYIVASHVVEHVPNPIRWFQMLFEILRPGGFIFLVIPDKRFTFDYQRPVTTFGAMLQSFLSGKLRPSAADVFDHHSSAVMIDGSRVWSGLLSEADMVPLASSKAALAYAKEVEDGNKYHDVHVSIFTPISFFSILSQLISTDIVFAEVTDFRDTDINDIEFFVCLEKPELVSSEVKQKCLDSIPRFNLNNLVSPYMPQVKSLSTALEKLSNTHSNFQVSYNELIKKERGLREELMLIKKQLNLFQAILNRRSIRLAMRLTHVLYKMRSLLKSNDK